MGVPGALREGSRPQATSRAPAAGAGIVGGGTVVDGR